MAIPLIVVGIAFAVAAAATAIGAAIAQGNLDKAKEIREKVLEQYGDDVVPHLDKAIAHEVGPTALAAIQTDSQTRETQVGAMKKLSDLYESGGMGRGDEAALQLANQGAQQRASSDYQSLMQNLSARGQAMNPALAAAMAAQSSGAVVDATARNRYQAQADARERAYAALRDSAALAGAVHNQDYGEAAATASAQDRINMFNAGQKTNADNENNRRRLQQFDADMAIRGARANAYNELARGEEKQADTTRATAKGIGDAALSAGGGIAGGMGGGGGGMGGGGGFTPMDAPAYGGNGSYGGSLPEEWENPYLNGGR